MADDTAPYHETSIEDRSTPAASPCQPTSSLALDDRIAESPVRLRCGNFGRNVPLWNQYGRGRQQTPWRTTYLDTVAMVAFTDLMRRLAAERY